MVANARAAVRDYLAHVGEPRVLGRPNGYVPHAEQRLRLCESQLEGPTTSLQRLELLQRRIELRAAVEANANGRDYGALEDSFVEVAAAYGEAKGISYGAWRAVGVPAAVLRRANISP